MELHVQREPVKVVDNPPTKYPKPQRRDPLVPQVLFEQWPLNKPLYCLTEIPVALKSGAQNASPPRSTLFLTLALLVFYKKIFRTVHILRIFYSKYGIYYSSIDL